MITLFTTHKDPSAQCCHPEPEAGELVILHFTLEDTKSSRPCCRVPYLRLQSHVV